MIHPELLWQEDFCERFRAHAGSVPMFVLGTTPTIDISTMQEIKSVTSAWFMYPMEDYDMEYWELLEIGEWPGVVCQVSSAVQLSSAIGLDEWYIPNAWVLHVEKV